MAHHVSTIKHVISLSCAIAFMCFTAWFSHCEISLHKPAVEWVVHFDDVLTADLQLENGDDAADLFVLQISHGLCCVPASAFVSFPLLPMRYFVAVGRAPPREFIS